MKNLELSPKEKSMVKLFVDLLPIIESVKEMRLRGDFPWATRAEINENLKKLKETREREKIESEKHRVEKLVTSYEEEKKKLEKRLKDIQEVLDKAKRGEWIPDWLP